MIKLLVTILFKSSAIIKVIFISILNETRFLFTGLFETIGRSFDNLNFTLLQPVRLSRFQDVRDFLSDHMQSIIILIFLTIVIVILSYKNIDSTEAKEDKHIY